VHVDGRICDHAPASPPMIPAPRTGSPRWPGDKSVPASAKPETGERIFQEAGSHGALSGLNRTTLFGATRDWRHRYDDERDAAEADTAV
jgi:hypothetical protein